MLTLIIGMIVFFGTHSVSIFARPFRNKQFSERPQLWKIGYSILSLIGLYLIVTGYGAARLEPVVIYQPPMWLRHLVMLLMIPVFPLVVASKLPCRIRKATKHPLLVATKLWALAHLLVNGMLADIVLFGGFLAWAVIDRIAIKRRAETTEPAKVGSVVWDIAAVVIGLALYGLFVAWAHKYLIGVPIIPG